MADFVGSSNVLPPAFVAKLTGISAHGAVRPEAVHLVENGHVARVKTVSFLGTSTRVSLEVDGLPMTMLLPKGAMIPKTGETVHVDWSPDDLHVMGA